MRKSVGLTFSHYHFFTFELFLFQSNLQPTVAAVSDRFGYEIFFLLQCKVDDSPFGRIQNAKRERQGIFTDMVAGEPGHRVQLGFARLAEPFGITDEPVLAIQLATEDLEQKNLERIEHFCVFGQRHSRIVARKIQQAALIGPAARYLEVQAEIINEP